MPYRKAEKRNDRPSAIGPGAAIFIILAAVGIFLFITAQPDKKDEPLPLKTVDRGVQCQRLMELAVQQGVAAGPAVGNRIVVDEKRWAALDAAARHSLADNLACAAFSGRGLDQLDADDFVEVYAFKSGKRLARGDSKGLTEY